MAVKTALALLSAAAFTVCFPPLHLRPLAWISLVPLFVALEETTPRRGAALGFLWAMVMACGITDWLPPSITRYYQQPLALGIVIFLGATASMVAVYFAAFGAIYARLARLPLLPRIPVIAAAWTLAELCRSRMLSGNPWGLLGYTQVGVAPEDVGGTGALALRIIQAADIGGVYLIGFLLAAINAAVAGAVAAKRDGRDFPARSAAAIAGAMLAPFAVYGELRLRTQFVEDDPRQVGVVQVSHDLGPQWERGQEGRNLPEYLDATAKLLDQRPPDLVVWPENAMTFFIDRRSDYQLTIARTLEPSGADLLAGGPRYEESTENGEPEFFNSAFALAPDGSLRDVYDKQHLLPFGEYFPLGSIELLRRRFAREWQLEPGSDIAPVTTAIGKASVAICNEVMFPRIVRPRVTEDARFIVNLANDSWMRSREYSEHQITLAALRSVEHRRYLIRAATAGHSAVVDAHGRVVRRADFDTTEAIGAAIGLGSRTTIYGRFGDWFAFSCVLGVALGLARSRERSLPA